MVTNTIIRTYNGIFTMFIEFIVHCCKRHDHGLIRDHGACNSVQ